MYWTYLLVTYPGNHVVRTQQKRHVTAAAMMVMSGTSMLVHGAAELSPWAVFSLRLVYGACVVSVKSVFPQILVFV